MSYHFRDTLHLQYVSAQCIATGWGKNIISILIPLCSTRSTWCRSKDSKVHKRKETSFSLSFQIQKVSFINVNLDVIVRCYNNKIRLLCSSRYWTGCSGTQEEGNFHKFSRETLCLSPEHLLLRLGESLGQDAMGKWGWAKIGPSVLFKNKGFLFIYEPFRIWSSVFFNMEMGLGPCTHPPRQPAAIWCCSDLHHQNSWHGSV